MVYTSKMHVSWTDSATPSSFVCLFCSGWICYAEKTHGEFILPHISTTRSPQQMMGSLVKSYFAEQQVEFVLTPEEHSTGNLLLRRNIFPLEKERITNCPLGVCCVNVVRAWVHSSSTTFQWCRALTRNLKPQDQTSTLTKLRHEKWTASSPLVQ